MKTMFGLATALKTLREIGGLTRITPGGRNEVAHHYEAGRNSDPDPLARTRISCVRDRRDELKPGSHRLFGVVLMGPRIAEVHENAVPHVLGQRSRQTG